MRMGCVECAVPAADSACLFAFTALAATVGWAILRTGLAWRWLGIASLVAAAVFMLGSIFSVLGATPEGRSSIYGIGLSILWMLLLGAGLLSASRTKASG